MLSFPFGFPRTTKLRAAREAGTPVTLTLRNPFAHSLSIIDTSAPVVNRTTFAYRDERVAPAVSPVDENEPVAAESLDISGSIELREEAVELSEPLAAETVSPGQTEEISRVLIVGEENGALEAGAAEQNEWVAVQAVAVEGSELFAATPVDLEQSDEIASGFRADDEGGNDPGELLDESEEIRLAIAAIKELAFVVETAEPEPMDRVELIASQPALDEETELVANSSETVEQREQIEIPDSVVDESEQVSDIVAFVADFEQIMAEAIAAAEKQSDAGVAVSMEAGEAVATAVVSAEKVEEIAVGTIAMPQRSTAADASVEIAETAEMHEQNVAASPIAKPAMPAALGLISRGWAWLKRNQQLAAAKKLRVSETVTLGDKRFVAVLHVEGQRYLIGGGSSGVSLLAQLGEKGEGEIALQPVVQRGSLAG